jgi:protein TonB
MMPRFRPLMVFTLLATLSQPVLFAAAPVLAPEDAPANKRAPNGDDEKTFDRPPSAVSQPRPVYPFALRRKGVSGDVSFSFLVDAKGNVREVHILSSTQPEFAEATIACVSKWKFRPATKAGKPVECRLSSSMSFSVADE